MTSCMVRSQTTLVFHLKIGCMFVNSLEFTNMQILRDLLNSRTSRVIFHFQNWTIRMSCRTILLQKMVLLDVVSPSLIYLEFIAPMTTHSFLKEYSYGLIKL